MSRPSSTLIQDQHLQVDSLYDSMNSVQSYSSSSNGKLIKIRGGHGIFWNNSKTLTD